MKATIVPRPFLKWPGGKSQLVDELIQRMPSQFGIYHEPFVGSGALFFRLWREGKIRRAVLSDINRELMDTYVAIRDNVEEVIKLLAEFPYSKEFYYQLREKDPWQLSLAERAARMIYLNKTGYNGLYRVNRYGKFNVPFGRYKSPRYLDRENLLAVSAALQNVELLCASFEIVEQHASAGDWVYFDPPYIPVSPTANFTAYSADGFSLADHERLRNLCVELSKRGVYILLSNSDTPAVHALYGMPPFEIDYVWANRAINCNGARRGKIREVVVTNYAYIKQQHLPLSQCAGGGSRTHTEL